MQMYTQVWRPEGSLLPSPIWRAGVTGGCELQVLLLEIELRSSARAVHTYCWPWKSQRASERASEHLEQVCLDVGRVPICIPAFQKPMQEDCYKSQASQRTPFLKTSSSDNRQANKTAANPNKPRTNVAAQPFQKVECLLSSTSLWVLFLWVIVFVS